MADLKFGRHSLSQILTSWLLVSECISDCSDQFDGHHYTQLFVQIIRREAWQTDEFLN